MKYIRTKYGRIVDIEKFINEEKDTPYYKDFEFEEISKDGVLKWTAIGTEKCSIKDQIGRRCHFSATLDSEIIKQADTIEELCDCFIAVDKNGNLCENPMIAKGHCFKSFCNYYKANGIDVDCYLAILTDKGLVYVAKMNDKGDLELI
ncbi:MAG: hypothetical protein K5765_06755 [Clostridia bacterium]|nr:hypothetical protein [Clostridia bacterium]